MIDWGVAINIFTLTVTIVSGLTVMLTFWNKWVYQPIQKRREEEAEKQNEKLIETINETNKPHLELLVHSQQRLDKLDEIAERNLSLWENLDGRVTTVENEVVGLDRRVFVLETTTNKSGKSKIDYKEEYKGENS